PDFRRDERGKIMTSSAIAAAAMIAVSLTTVALAKDAKPTLDQLESRIAAAETQVARAHDYEELENLKSAYGYYLDKSLWAEVAGLFAEDGTLEIGGRGVFVGREKVHQSLS